MALPFYRRQGPVSSSTPLTMPTDTSTFSTPPLSSATPSPTGGGGGGGNTGGGSFNNGPSPGSSASLYLYTFLATLVLLLGVSSAIVIRSLILRRRHRRMIEEAIRNGTWVPPVPRQRVDPSKKPKMFHTWMARGAGSGAGGAGGAGYSYPGALAEKTDEWEHILPFSATYVTPPHANSALPTAALTPSPEPAPPTRGLSSLAAALRSRIVHRRDPTPSTPSSPQSSPPSSAAPHTPQNARTSAPADGARLCVAVIIAMPSQPGPPRINPAPDEEELPHVEFGVAELTVREGSSEKRSSSMSSSEGGPSSQS